MFLRKSSLILAFAIVSFVLLVAPPQQLGRWSFERSYCYQHHRNTLQRSTNGPTTNATEGHANKDITAPPSGPNCDTFPDTSGILLVMKTGASESFDKVPTQLMTMLRCLPDFIIFGDMNQNIAGHYIHDSLQAVLSEAKDDNPDFDIYRRQRRCVVDQDNCNKLGNAAEEAWNLDKYKNIHIAEKVYQLKPGYNWYVFVDADTYVLWPNLVRWLARFDHTKRHYLGSVALIHDFPFGHGGSGYVVSRAAMDDFVGQGPGVANKYDIRVKAECCGDYMFSVAIKETASISVEQMWPTINGEKPPTLPFGPTHWCHPIVTMHHMNSEEVSSFWEFERRWYSVQPPASNPPMLLIRDIYTEFFAPKLQRTREDWDNLSDDRFYLDPNDTRLKDRRDRMKDESEYNEDEKTAHLSFDHCRAACESLSHEECFQFKYEDGLCSTSNSFKLGKPVKRIGNKGSTSGWDVAKIREWAKAQNCQKPVYPHTR